MSDALFEWDEAKAVANERKPGIPFSYAMRGFSDRKRIEVLDRRYEYGEERFKIVAAVEESILAVIFARHGENIRIISARLASREERSQYRALRS
jgi:uncharacterized DUF497 family protein